MVTFEDLDGSDTLMKFADMVRELTGLLVRVADPSGKKWGRQMFPPELEAPLCRLIHSIPAGLQACQKDDVAHLKRAQEGRHEYHYRCYAGLVAIAAPVYVNGRHVATLCCGPLLPEPPSQKNAGKYIRRLEKFGLKPAAIRAAYFNSPHLPPEKFIRAVRLIAFFAEYLGETSQRLKSLTSTGCAAVDKAKQYAWEHYTEPIRFDHLAAQIGYSRAYLSTLFKKTTGEPWCSFLQRIRIGKAVGLLEKTALTITDIALAAGFDSLTHFNRVFHKIKKCSPSAYRRTIKCGSGPISFKKS